MSFEGTARINGIIQEFSDEIVRQKYLAEAPNKESCASYADFRTKLGEFGDQIFQSLVERVTEYFPTEDDQKLARIILDSKYYRKYHNGTILNDAQVR